MIVTFGGKPGSGKTTIAKRLARALGYPRFSMGQMMREMAKRRGMTLEQYHRLCKQSPTADREVDAYQEQLGRQRKNLIIEGRTSFYFIPSSTKIFLDVSPREGARRIVRDLRRENKRNEGTPRRLIDVERMLRRRMRSDRERYRKYYGINPFLRKHYDLYLNTSSLTADEVFRRVRNFVVKIAGGRRRR